MRASVIVDRASSHETMGNLDQAYSDFRTARGLDRNNRAAEDGFKRVEDKIIASGRKPGAGDNL